MKRMRIAPGVLAIIKETDPDTKITLHFIRRLIKSGNVPVVRVGRKVLVDADMLIDYITSGNTVEEIEPVVQGIRKVKV
ncbi:helix-turn-helix domain-containing protein [Scatolibacter rhodanostii]|uniref:helix-turn-helix domain-containing protein n=1 Tax=Scatolibacter rhodanostii TaxID=2014781 RepID=UPI00117C9CA9|nr:helix-turn-helix domain-containing protein [Scatolibacter rhodanostii]